VVHGKARILGNFKFPATRGPTAPIRQAGLYLFTGSSSIRYWRTLSDDMKPLDASIAASGGSQIAQVNQYAARIVIPYRPRAVVLYAGDNDLSGPWSKSPETVQADFARLSESFTRLFLIPGLLRFDAVRAR